MAKKRIKYEQVFLAALALSAVCHLMAAFVPAGLVRFFINSDEPLSRAVRFEVVNLPEPDKVPVFRVREGETAEPLTVRTIAPPVPRISPADSPATDLAWTQIHKQRSFPDLETDSGGETPAASILAGPDSLLAVSRYIAGVYERINRVRRYPEISRRLGEEGAVEIGFTIGRDGALDGETELVSASPFSALNRAARRSVSGSSPFPPLPPCIHQPVLPVKVRILFQLER